MRRRSFFGLGAFLNVILGSLQGAWGQPAPPPLPQPTSTPSDPYRLWTIRLGRARWAWDGKRWVVAAEKYTEFSMGPLEDDGSRRPVIGETKWHTRIELPSWRDDPEALSPHHFVTAAWATGARGWLMSYCQHHGGPGPDLNDAMICAYCRKEMEDDA